MGALIGLAGAHRTGKTTLARLIAKSIGIELVDASVRTVFEQLGVDPKEDYSFDKRLWVQNEILAHAANRYAGVKGIGIVDRTPLDFLAYTMADVQRGNLSPQQSDQFIEYMTRCVELANWHFSMIVLVQPGIPLTECDTSAPALPAYMEHINTILKGLMAERTVAVPTTAIPRGVIDLTLRGRMVVQSHNRVHQQAKASMAEHSAH